MSDLERFKDDSYEIYCTKAVVILFARLQASYPSQWLRYCELTGQTTEEMRGMWGQDLRKYLGKLNAETGKYEAPAIRYALENLPEFVPSLPAFKSLCAAYKAPLPSAVLLPKKVPTQQERDAELAALAKISAKARENRMAANQEKLCAAYRKPVTQIQRLYFFQGCKTGVGPGANIMREQLKHLVETSDSCVTNEMIALKNTLFGETKALEVAA